jgi:hypothetical protein
MIKQGLHIKEAGVIVTREGEFECALLGPEATLKHTHWPSWLEKPPTIDDDDARDRNYVRVRSRYGSMVPQPRKTICYGHSYAYSGQAHPVEAATPPWVESLYDATERLCGERMNMCLVNIYNHGHHSISAHSDDERQMGASHSVYCWVVVGGEGRQAIFKEKAGALRVYHVTIPEGLYVMCGARFQRDWTHEFPKCHEYAFKKHFTPCIPVGETTTTSLEKADWVWEHCEEVRERLRGTKYYDVFVEWCRPRVSYTLRYFETDSNYKKIKLVN